MTTEKLQEACGFAFKLGDVVTHTSQRHDSDMFKQKFIVITQETGFEYAVNNKLVQYRNYGCRSSQTHLVRFFEHELEFFTPDAK